MTVSCFISKRQLDEYRTGLLTLLMLFIHKFGVQCVRAFQVWLWLTEFGGVALSCFTLDKFSG